MFIQQLYTSCLAEAAYYIESEGEAIVIDPLREPEPYINLAKTRNARIKYVMETHFHADFVSGHLDLSKLTGAPIIFGPQANTDYDIYKAKDDEVFTVGACKIKILHTPGHTPESSCFLLYDEQGDPHALFTGDTLFVGDVGRPDLLDGLFTREEMAGMLFDSLQTKFKGLPDKLLIYPAHGPGSACGKNIGKETWSTLGEQKQLNYALKETDRFRFIQSVTEGLSTPPAYFFFDAEINKKGYAPLEEVLKKNLVPLKSSDIEALKGFTILDTRNPDDFEKGFIPGSINIGLNGTFAVWVGSVIKPGEKLVIVADPGKEEESITRLARVGYENIAGFLEGGFSAWTMEGRTIDRIESISPEEFKEESDLDQIEILDVRKAGEFESGHVKDAINIPLSDITANAPKLNGNYLVHCAGGYRSMIACSILKANGVSMVKNVHKGFAGIAKTGVEIVLPENV